MSRIPIDRASQPPSPSSSAGALTHTSASSSSPSLHSLPVLIALASKAEDALAEVVAAHRNYTTARGTRQHGALALAVAHAQHVLTALERLREQRERQRQQQQHTTSTATTTASSKEALVLHVRLDKIRMELRRALPRSVTALEEADGNSDAAAGGSSASAASTAAALRSLLHTRAMLSTELHKMDAAVQGLAGSGESLQQLHQSLHDVHSTMSTAQVMVRKLLTIQSRDDLILRVSAVLFGLVVAFIVVQRVGRFFPVTVYVAVDD